MADEQQPQQTLLQQVKPTRKVSVAGVAGAMTGAILWYGNRHGWQLPAEAGAWITTGVSFALSWLVPEADQA